MSGGAGGDIYIFQRGDGQDVIDDHGTFSFGPVKAGIDFLSFQGGITADDLKLIRDGESANLKIVILDDDGNPTGDTHRDRRAVRRHQDRDSACSPTRWAAATGSTMSRRT